MSPKQVVVAGAVLMMAASAFAQDKKIDRSALPAGVEKTVQTQSQGCTIKGFGTEKEHGKTLYEVEMISNGHTKDLSIAADGTLLEVEEEVAFDALPDAVKKGLTAKAGAAKITKVESLTKGGKLVAYEAATLKGAKKGEVQVGPEGKALAHAE